MKNIEENKIKKLIKNIIDDEFKKNEDKFLTKQQVKDLIQKAFVKQNKFMWEKSKFITSYLKEL